VKSAVKDQVPDAGYIILTIDNLPPELRDLTDNPDPQENGDFVNITVNVTDDIGVNTVWVNITYPNGSWVNESMIWSGGDIWFYNYDYDTLGIYYYTVWANDSGINWNYTGPGDFTIHDTDGPQFDNIIDIPDPQVQGGFVNISVDVTEDVGIYDVWVNITYPNGSWYNTSMQPGLGDQYFFNYTYDDSGLYSYTIWANDTSGNLNWTNPGGFGIGDNSRPELSDLADAPDPQENGFYVNITVNVTDDVAVGEVWLNITYPDNAWKNVSMQFGGGDVWYYNRTYHDIGSYSYTVWANDTSSNWNSTGPADFMIRDTDPPELDNLVDVPDPQGIGGNVIISVDVIDDVAVDEVWVNITYPDGSFDNVSMQSGVGDEWFYGAAYIDLDIHDYTVWAKDTSDNWNSTGPGTFMIQDLDAPEFIMFDDFPDPQENGGNVNITASIIDDVGVGEVWVNILYPGGSQINVSMNHGIGNDWYYNSAYDVLGIYSYIFWVNDVNDNWNSTGPGEFTIRDTDGPEIINLNDAPDPQENGGEVNINADVIDDIAVDEVWIAITNPGGSTVNTSMVHQTGDTWFYNAPYTALGDYSYRIWASDTRGNWNSSVIGSFNIQDTDKPEIGDPGITPEIKEIGGDINVTVEVTDDVGVEEVWINVIFPNGTSFNFSMKQGAGDEWFFNSTFNGDGNYSYIIWAVDPSGNWNSTNPETFTIEPEPPAEPEELPTLLYVTLLFIFWPLLLMVFTVALLRRNGFSNRYKRDVDGLVKTASFIYANQPENLPANIKAIQTFITLSLKTGIPVEEFYLATLSAKSMTENDLGLSGKIGDNLIAITSLFER
jgi:hypothetical protein